MTLQQREEAPFRMRVLACERGWIDVEFSAGQACEVVSFSAVFDPLPALQAWLEALVIGVQVCAFAVDDEREGCTFHAQRDGPDDVQFTLRAGGLEACAGVLFALTLERRALIEAIYRGITAFAHSPQFDPNEWDALAGDDVSDDAAWELGPSHGGTPLAGWRSELIERWLGRARDLQHRASRLRF